ncbi:MAG: TrkA family potassium uptake protein [Dehalococcoidia bacterium]|nr:TrkA family potassium uptake protein [Dehalococcoidia bacterium]
MTSSTRLLVKKVVIGGCGRTGVVLASTLCESGSLVQVLDSNPSAFDRLPPDLVSSARVQLRLADVTLASSLRIARAQDADVFISVTGSDSVNATAAQIAHHILRVPTVICRTDDPVKRGMYETLDITAVSQADLIRDMVIRIVSDGGAGQ